MTWEIVVIGAVRVLGSLPVLRWAFAGAIIAILVDFSDLFLMNLLDLGGLRNYQLFDKYLDQFYLVLFLIVSLRWHAVARNVAVALFVYRLPGFVLFELTHRRGVLLFFPNVFEFWFLYVAAVLHWRPQHVFTLRTAVLALVPLTLAKLAHEYVLHWGRWLDGFTALEAVDAIWERLRGPF